MDAFHLGLSIGLILGEGHFTTHGGQPALQIRVHRRDVDVLETVRSQLQGRVFGPYSHEGRHSYVYLLRGSALRDALPILHQYLPSSFKRDQFDAWRSRHADALDRPRPSPALLDRMERMLATGNRSR